jgi:hypothetical protein
MEMRKRSAKNAQSTRQSVFFPRPREREISEIDSAYYADMFREDLSMLLPSYQDAKSVIRLEPPDTKAEPLIEGGLGIHHVHADFSAAASEFIRLAAMTVAGYGDAFYEITYESLGQGQQPAEFHFQFIDPESVVVRRGDLIQKIDPNVARERRVPERIYIPKETVMKLSPPAGWSREFRRICYGLTRISQVVVPDFAYPRVAGELNAVPIDVTEYLKTQKLAVLAVTKRTGWNVRRLSSGEISGYYWFRRWLRFEKLKIQLRTSLVECLNDGLRRVGKVVGFSSRIVISGLPTLPDIAVAEDQLRKGLSNLGEITKPFLRG